MSVAVLVGVLVGVVVLKPRQMAIGTSIACHVRSPVA